MSTDEGAPAPSPQVKLIVWDLDETLWRGILSEGPVEMPPQRHGQLERLVDHGIMVSVSSRNDADAARAELERHGVWDLFIFPRINWEAKGAQIRDLIEAAQLRPANVLFVDDNHLNREEAAYFAPGLQTADPAVDGFDERIDAIAAHGKDDPGRRRLAEYQLLEAKASEAATFGDNASFLRSCAIRVVVDEHPARDADRLLELIGRTNQLNYTKRRIDAAELRDLLGDPEARCVSVRVTDRFGDYGLVGFAAVRAGRVEQLAFSCRILGMGVERLVYERLGRPAIVVANPVSAPLEGEPPDWLTLLEAGADEADEPAAATTVAATSTPAATGRILFVGGCDLESAVAFLDTRHVTTHFNCSPPDRPRMVVHRDGIDYLLGDELPAASRDAILADAPFLDGSVFDTPDWAAFDHIVYSPLIDYVQAKYVNDALPGVYVSYGDVERPVIDEARIAVLVERHDADGDRFQQFTTRWRPEPKPDEVWEAQLRRLFDRMHGARTVTVLLGATRTWDGLDTERIPMHRHANELIRRAAAGHPNVGLLDVDPLLHERADFADSIRHYSRRVYREIALAIVERVGASEIELAPERAPRPPRPRSMSAAGRLRRTIRGGLRRAGLRG